MRVAVPFGKSKIYTALVAEIHTQTPEAYEAKEIHQILDLPKGTATRIPAIKKLDSASVIL